MFDVGFLIFSLLVSGGAEKQKCFMAALLQFHCRVKQTSHSIVEEHEVESLFTTDKLRKMSPPTIPQKMLLMQRGAA